MGVLASRIEIMRGSGYISDHAACSLSALVDVVSRETGASEDDVRLSSLVTHVAAALHRAASKESVRPVPPEVMEEVRDSPVFDEALRIQGAALDALSIDLDASEKDFILVHIGGLLTSLSGGEEL